MRTHIRPTAVACAGRVISRTHDLFRANLNMAMGAGWQRSQAGLERRRALAYRQITIAFMQVGPGFDIKGRHACAGW